MLAMRHISVQAPCHHMHAALHSAACPCGPMTHAPMRDRPANGQMHTLPLAVAGMETLYLLSQKSGLPCQQARGHPSLLQPPPSHTPHVPQFWPAWSAGALPAS